MTYPENDILFDMSLFDVHAYPQIPLVIDHLIRYYNAPIIQDNIPKACKLTRDKIQDGLGLEIYADDNPLRYNNILGIGLTIDLILEAYIGPERNLVQRAVEDIKRFLPRDDLEYRTLKDQEEFVMALRNKIWTLSTRLQPEKVY